MAGMRKVFLIRHCESEANKALLVETRGDSVLTDVGVEQARRRARALADHDLADVTMVASPLARASRTAREIADHHGWEVSHDHRLTEGDLGMLEGLRYDELGQHVPAGAKWLDAETHGGESEAVVGARMLEALAEALEASSGPLVLVSHGYAISALLQRLGHDVGRPLSNGDMYELEIDEAIAIHRAERHPLGG